VTETLAVPDIVTDPTEPVAERPVGDTFAVPVTVTDLTDPVADRPVGDTFAPAETVTVPTEPAATPIFTEPVPQPPTPHPEDLFQP
jgi:hypothetical protein